MLKRTLKRVAFDSLKSQPVNEEARKHQTLLQDYLVLQKEFVSTKKTLQATKQKRDILMAEVQFLRHRYRCLMGLQPHNIQSEQEQDNDLPQNSNEQFEDIGKPPGTKKKPKNGLINGERVVRNRGEKKKPKNGFINGERVVKNREEKNKMPWQDQSALMDI